MRSALSKILLVAVALGANVSMVYAAEPETQAERDSVRFRTRPAYDAVGIRAGGFTVFPQASVEESYDDNIYATDVNETDDFITTLATSVAVNSNWNRHSLNFLAGLSQDIYADHTDENRFDWNAGFDGNLDITRDTTLGGGASYRKLHEDRVDPNAPAAPSEPTPYTLANANLNFQQKFNRLSARVSGGVDDYNYEDILSTTGVNIDQDDRDRIETFEALRFGYDVSPDTNVYIEGTINQRSYDETPPTVAFDRSSDGYSVVGGSEFRLSNLAQGKVFVGYQEQTYDDAALSNVSGLSYGANVEWYVTGLTTVTFDAASTIEERNHDTGCVRLSVAERRRPY